MCIRDSYRIEKDARKEVARLQLKGPAAHAIYSRLRAEQSKPQLDKLHSRLSALSPRYPEGTGQRQAFDYLLTRWECFTLYSKSGEIPIDNNDCERAQRAVVDVYKRQPKRSRSMALNPPRCR